MNRTVKEHLVFYKLFTICACLAPACLKDKTKFCYPQHFWRRRDWEKYIRFTSNTKWTKTIGWKIKSFRIILQFGFSSLRFNLLIVSTVHDLGLYPILSIFSHFTGLNCKVFDLETTHNRMKFSSTPLALCNRSQ